MADNNRTDQYGNSISAGYAGHFVDDQPWLAARAKTGGYGQNMPVAANVTKVKTKSFPAVPTKRVYLYDASAVPSDTAIVPDLNKYRPGFDLRRAWDEGGCRRLILRLGGPTQFIYDNWNLTVDPTYYGYFEQAREIGYTIGSYVVYSAGIDQRNYQSSEILLEFVEKAFGSSHQYKPDWMIVDDEVNYWWQNNSKVTATEVNQVDGLRYMLPKIWKYFKLVPMHYSAMWFMGQNAKYHDAYMNWLDVANNTLEGKTIMNWYAWYLDMFQNGDAHYTNIADTRAAIPEYSQSSINNYLSIGSYSLYDLHQITSNWITPWIKNSSGQPYGVDMSVSRKSEQLFFADMLINTTPADSQAPSAPLVNSAPIVTATTIGLTWTPSSDNVAVAGYDIFVNGDQVAQTTDTQYVLSVNPSTTYMVALDAFDAAGNHSAKSSTLIVNTPAAGNGCKPALAILLSR